MNNEKLDNQLELALSIPQNEREGMSELNTGYIEETNSWELIVRYNGDISQIGEELGISVNELSAGYAVLVISETLIGRLSEYPQIIFIEKPKLLQLESEEGRRVSCIPGATINSIDTLTSQNVLSGEGIITAIIDSGIDYLHPDFRNSDGTTRILTLWDQTIPGGIYNSDYINQAIFTDDRQERENLLPTFDISGHGTAVAGIACGNGAQSGGRFRGIAFNSSIVAVKLGTSVSSSFPMTAQLMKAVDFCINTAVSTGQPLAINISFGTSYGAHNGSSLIEGYLNDTAGYWQNCISAGTGNEAASARHTSGRLLPGQGSNPGSADIIEIVISEFTSSINLQLWKQYNDTVNIFLISPSGELIGPVRPLGEVQVYTADMTTIRILYGEPVPFNSLVEVYFEFSGNYIAVGIWKLILEPVNIQSGYYDLWLPSGAASGTLTRFLSPTPENTLTIPSTAERIISVGAYNGLTDSYASFSGRGRECGCPYIPVKPDIVAPGVSITTCSPGGGYVQRTGTSFATPFVTGSCALLMEWGIVRGNDPFLYGEKVKAYLIRGARRLPGFSQWPNSQVGWGALCVRDSLPV